MRGGPAHQRCSPVIKQDTKCDRQAAVDHPRTVPAKVKNVAVEDGEVSVELAAGDFAAIGLRNDKDEILRGETRASGQAAAATAIARANLRVRSARSCLQRRRRPIFFGRNCRDNSCSSVPDKSPSGVITVYVATIGWNFLS